MKIAKYLKEPCLLIKDVSETVENEVKNKRGFLDMLAATLGILLLVNVLVGKGLMIAGEGTIRTGKVQDF